MFESNLRIKQMGLGKTLQAISFLSYLKFHQGLRGPFRESMRSASLREVLMLFCVNNLF